LIHYVFWYYGVRVEQYFEHVQHRLRQMRKYMISSKSVFNLPFPEFCAKMSKTNFYIFPYFLLLLAETQKTLKIPFLQDFSQVSSKLCVSTFPKFLAHLRDQVLNLAPECTCCPRSSRYMTSLIHPVGE
jgi:hypothetical protein